MKLTSYMLLGTLLFISFNLDAQRWKSRRYESYLGLGTVQHYGDIGGSMTAANWYGLNDIQLQFTRPSLHAGVRYKIFSFMAVKANLSLAYIDANDKNTPNEEARYGGYSFRSVMGEATAQLEYYFLKEDRMLLSDAIYNRKGMVNDFFNIDAYVFAGAGGVLAFPTVYNSSGQIITSDEWEFNAAEMKNFGLTFPVGLGIKYRWDSRTSFGLEFGRRFTLTDNIDGYTSMYSKSNDVYDFLVVSMVYRIATDRRGLPILGKAAKYRQ